MFECINRLITIHDFSLQSWNDRYGKGIWACISPNEFLLDEFRECTSDGDIDMINASDYIETAEWLPFVTGKDFTDALNLLEKFLSSLPQEMLDSNSIWSLSIYKALQNLQEMRRKSTYNLYNKLPVTLEELLSNTII
ncbi:Uncharacterised protein [Legionella busanensis]|uniref:Uncharacterized protein n=1 Tax=Legionella busanensis TaxID=190655 RepID=A0A378KBP7_9GAMM|nr:hypothetical protein [Legionella busanensis]STX81593.1 Uncharacterised protein [Legionella busanensis]